MKIQHVISIIILPTILVIFNKIESIEGLQCYVCENCMESEDTYELQICSELPAIDTASPTRVPASGPLSNTTLAALTSQGTGQVTLEEEPSTPSAGFSSPSSVITTEPDTEYEYEEYEYEEEYENENGEEKMDKKKGTKRNAKAKLIDQQKDEIITANRKYQRFRQQRRDEAVCYMMTIRVNATTTRSMRGCTNIIGNSRNDTCQSLTAADEELIDCRLCVENGCNKFGPVANEIHVVMSNADLRWVGQGVGGVCIALWGAMIASVNIYFK